MKKEMYIKAVLAAMALASGIACEKEGSAEASAPEDPVAGIVSLEGVARMLSSLPMTGEHLNEVYGAVESSSGNGYDEEYTLKRLFNAPGTGVGDEEGSSRAAGGSCLRDLIADYLGAASRSSEGVVADAERCIKAMTESDMQIYWPYSEDWDGKTYPIVTYDPGYGSESNYGFLIGFDESGNRKVDSVLVNEAVAREHPVWVINRNDDSAFTPLAMLIRNAPEAFGQPSSRSAAASVQNASASRTLMIRTFEMKRNYDSWFGGASEFFIKCGTVKGFTAKTEAEMKLYSPSVTDMMIVVRRRDVGKPVPFDAVLLSGFTNQLDKLALLITEDDGGTRTTWKCEATVKVNSKSYGFNLEIPFNEKDDIVWRGQLPASYFQSEDEVKGRFGDVVITFALE